MANFVLLGAAGYIAPRHMEAIQFHKHNLIAAMDPSDSVGILDSYAPQCRFFTETADLDSFLKDQKVDYVSICSPNYLHFDQITWALKRGAHAICEKPLVLTAAQVDQLTALEKDTGKKVFTVLQLRVHEAIKKLKAQVEKEKLDHYSVDLTYLTSRGPWYLESWKGDIEKSGGLSTNIGIHFFDMLTWIFGGMKSVKMSEKTKTLEAGVLELERATVKWMLSIDRTRLPEAVVASGKTTYRSITINNFEFEFSEGFTELHRIVYDDILNGRGYGVTDARAAIAIAEQIRKS